MTETRQLTGRPSVTIVTPTLNAARYFDACLRSVELQRADVDVEHIVVDDGSTDGTLEQAERSGAQVIDGKRDGLYAAMNQGLAAASGAYVGVLNGDDFLYPGAIARLVRAMQHTDRPWAIGRLRWVDGAGESLGEMAPPPSRASASVLASLGWNWMYHQTTYMRADFWHQVGGFDTSYDVNADFDVLLRARNFEPLCFRERAHRRVSSARVKSQHHRADVRHRKCSHQPGLRSALVRRPRSYPAGGARVYQRPQPAMVSHEADRTSAGDCVTTVTAITPVRNGAALIGRTVTSIASQSAVQSGRVELQYLLCDGASTDATVAVALAAAESAGVKLDVTSEPDGGMYDALSKGLARAEGDIVFYLNAGDMLFPAALDTVIDIMTAPSSSVDWLTGYSAVFNEAGVVVDTCLPFRYRRRLLRTGIYGHGLPTVQQNRVFGATTCSITSTLANLPATGWLATTIYGASSQRSPNPASPGHCSVGSASTASTSRTM